MLFALIWTFVMVVFLAWKVDRLRERVEKLEAQQEQRNQQVTSGPPPLDWNFQAITDARRHTTRVG